MVIDKELYDSADGRVDGHLINRSLLESVKESEDGDLLIVSFEGGEPITFDQRKSYVIGHGCRLGRGSSWVSGASLKTLFEGIVEARTAKLKGLGADGTVETQLTIRMGSVTGCRVKGSLRGSWGNRIIIESDKMWYLGEPVKKVSFGLSTGLTMSFISSLCDTLTGNSVNGHQFVEHLIIDVVVGGEDERD